MTVLKSCMGKEANNSSFSLYYKPKSLTGVFMDLRKITLERYSVEYMSDVIEWGHGK